VITATGTMVANLATMLKAVDEVAAASEEHVRALKSSTSEPAAKEPKEPKDSKEPK
jgi:hypothetical protein